MANNPSHQGSLLLTVYLLATLAVPGTVALSAQGGVLTLSVNPAYNSTLFINGMQEQLTASGSFTLPNASYGSYNVSVENPYMQFYSKTFYLNSSHSSVFATVNMGAPAPFNFTGYPWLPLGPAHIPNFQGRYGGLQNATGHICLFAIDGSDPKIIYGVSGTSTGDAGPDGSGGVYKTVNNGKTWVPADLGLPYGVISDIWINQSNPDELLVGFTLGGIYRTDDGGGWWYKVSQFNFTKDITEVNGTLFAGSLEGVISSSDSGRTWRLVFPKQYVFDFSESNGVFYAFSDMNKYLYKSIDGGALWTKAYNFSKIGADDVWSITVSPWNSSLIYAAIATSNASETTAWVSYDGGSTFEPAPGLNSSLDNYGNKAHVVEVLFDPLNRSRMWAHGGAYAAYSFDGGRSFHTTAQGTDNGGMIVDPKNDSIVIIGSDQGVYESRDSGVTYKAINGNLSTALSYGLAMSNNGNFIMLEMQDYGTITSRNGGRVWESDTLPFGEGTAIYVNPYNNSWIYAFAENSHLSVSNDAANTFTYLPSVPVISSYCCVVSSMMYANPYNHTQALFSTQSGLYIGSSYGASWNLMSGSPQNETGITMVGPGRYVVGTTDGVFWNSGSTWSMSSGISGYRGSDGYVDSVVADPANSSVVLALTGEFSPNGRVFISTNGGKNFSQLESNLVLPEYLGAAPWRGRLVFLNTTGYPLLAATSGGAYISTNLGKSWIPINYNIHAGIISGAQMAGRNLYISTFGEGVMEYPNFSTSGLPATINGEIVSANASLNIDGSMRNLYDGHFTEFLPPGKHNIAATALSAGYVSNIILLPAETYNITLYLIKFYESGLPVGSRWSVTFGNQTITSRNASISFMEQSGSYNYSVGAVPDYTANRSAGSFAVGGNATAINMSFAPVAPSTITTTVYNASAAQHGTNSPASSAGGSSTRPSGYWEYYVLVAVVIALLAFFLFLKKRKDAPTPSQPAFETHIQ